MADVYYTCNLLPPQLVSARGHSLRWLGNHLDDVAASSRRDALGVHPMTCPYVTRLVTAAESVLATASADDCVIVPGGCDAMRRLGDLLAATYPERVFVLYMPRSAAPGSRGRLARDLAALDEWLAQRRPVAPPAPGATESPPEADGPRLQHVGQPQPGGVFIVAGPLSDDSLLRLITDLGAGVAGLESCTAPERWLALCPGSESGEAEEGPTEHTFERFAALMLDAGACPRRSTLDRRSHLESRLDQARPSAVIYARQSFCDPGAYDALEVARLAEERGLPFLEIEVGFPFESSGPLRTRVEAFLEAQSIEDDLLAGFDDDLFGDSSGLADLHADKEG